MDGQIPERGDDLKTADGEIAPPWKKADERQEHLVPVAMRRATAPKDFVVPRLYGREDFPPSSGKMPRVAQSPALSVVAGRDIVLAPRRIVLSRKSGGILPSSFTRFGNAQHGALQRKDGVHLPIHADEHGRPEQMRGAVYLADTPYPDIYGHFLLEVLPQLWGFGEVPRRAKVATSVPLSADFLKLFAALGVDADSIMPLSRPIEAEETYVPSMPLMLRDHVHPTTFEIFDRLARLGLTSDAPTPEKLYVSRSLLGPDRRTLTNEAQIEVMFEAAGFTVFHPQLHPIEDQIRVFSKARLVAGPSGSGFHNTIFAPFTSKLLIISSTRWFTVIDPLLNQVDGRLGLVFGEALASDEALADVKARWSVDYRAVREAAATHFDIAM